MGAGLRARWRPLPRRRAGCRQDDAVAPALRRAGAYDDIEVLDSDEIRRRVRRRLGFLPYVCWRPLVHLLHYLRIVRAVRGPADRTILIHDTGTHTWLRRGLRRVARRSGRPMHALLLDVDPTRAWAGQRTRDRQVSPRRFAHHTAGWRELLDAVTDDPTGAESYASCVLFDRAAATRLRAISVTTRAPDMAVCQAMA
ncbi:MAG: ATP-binding protein [Streptosporangiales bacterium]|nr:ATP-binding protein [Streptosporangiales bacterium]